jgi:hypothetical protein
MTYQAIWPLVAGVRVIRPMPGRPGVSGTARAVGMGRLPGCHAPPLVLAVRYA